MTEAPSKVLFSEPGASWWWMLIGPIAGGSMAYIQNTTGNGFDVTVPLIFFTLVSAFALVQVKAARIHTSVELTRRVSAPGPGNHPHRGRSARSIPPPRAPKRRSGSRRVRSVS